MSRATELAGLRKAASKSGGWIASPCPKCSWWRLDGGNRLAYEEYYNKHLRCKCR